MMTRGFELGLLIVWLGACGGEATAAGVCAGRGLSVVVDGPESKLHLCQSGRSIEHFRVAFGREGLGKTRQGDNKTPLGTYRLGAPRRSGSGFHRFIEIRVPRKMGVHVGIHGPKAGTRWLRGLTTWVDWTQGCIALGTTDEIDRVARFVKGRRVRQIHILGTP